MGLKKWNQNIDPDIPEMQTFLAVLSLYITVLIKLLRTLYIPK